MLRGGWRGLGTALAAGAVLGAVLRAGTCGGCGPLEPRAGGAGPCGALGPCLAAPGVPALALTHGPGRAGPARLQPGPSRAEPIAEAPQSPGAPERRSVLGEEDGGAGAGGRAAFGG